MDFPINEVVSVVNDSGLRRRGTGILVFNNLDYEKILIQRRSSKDSNPGKLSIPGGCIHVGEAYLRGARRKLNEEMFCSRGINGLKLERLFKIEKMVDNGLESVQVYRTVSKGPFRLQIEEVDCYSFNDFNQVLKDIKVHPQEYTETTVLSLEEYRKRFL